MENEFKSLGAGVKIGENFKILRKIEPGGGGPIFLGIDGRTKDVVTIRFFSRHIISDFDSFLTRIRQIEKIQNALQGIVLFPFEYGDWEGIPYTAFKGGAPKTFGHLFSAGRKFSEKDIHTILEQILKMFIVAHKSNILHLGLSPISICRKEGGGLGIEPCVVDLGLIPRKGHEYYIRPAIEEKKFVSIASYMSPEQAEGKREVDFKSDLYSIGCIVYRLVFGKDPFEGKDTDEIIKKVLEEEPGGLEGKEGKIGEGMREFLRRALQKDPLERFSSAEEMLESFYGSMISSGRGESVSKVPIAVEKIKETPPVTAGKATEFKHEEGKEEPKKTPVSVSSDIEPESEAKEAKSEIFREKRVEKEELSSVSFESFEVEEKGKHKITKEKKIEQPIRAEPEVRASEEKELEKVDEGVEEVSEIMEFVEEEKKEKEEIEPSLISKPREEELKTEETIEGVGAKKKEVESTVSVFESAGIEEEVPRVEEKKVERLEPVHKGKGKWLWLLIGIIIGGGAGISAYYFLSEGKSFLKPSEKLEEKGVKVPLMVEEKKKVEKIELTEEKLEERKEVEKPKPSEVLEPVEAGSAAEEKMEKVVEEKKEGEKEEVKKLEEKEEKVTPEEKGKKKKKKKRQEKAKKIYLD